MTESRNPAVGVRRGARRKRASTRSERVDAVAGADAAGEAPGEDRTGGPVPKESVAGASGTGGAGDVADERSAEDAASETTAAGAAGDNGAEKPSGSGAADAASENGAQVPTGSGAAGESGAKAPTEGGADDGAGERSTEESATEGGSDDGAGERSTEDSATEGGSDDGAGERSTEESATEGGSDAAAPGERSTEDSATEGGADAATSAEAAGKPRKRASSTRAKPKGDAGPRRSSRARQPAKGQGKPRSGKPKGGKRKPAGKGRRPPTEGRRRASWSGELELSDGGLAVADADGNLIQYAPAKVASSLRYLLARLERDPGVGLPKRVAFTSVLSGEGVSVVARSFAAVLAHDTGRTVCVVDLNWWSTDESARGKEAEPHGLYEVLWMEKPLEAVLARTQTPELFYLHAGSAPPTVRPMLAHHPRLGATLDELASRFDHLVVDLPAVGARSEAIGLSQFCDWVILVIQQGVPSRKQLQSALADLGDTRPVAAVLNRSQSKIPSFIRRLLGL